MEIEGKKGPERVFDNDVILGSIAIIQEFLYKTEGTCR